MSCPRKAQASGAEADDLAGLGEDALRAHLTDRALAAHARYPGLSASGLGVFLKDTECLRHPCRLLFELGDMAAHQFVHPGPRPMHPAQGEMVIFVHPALRAQPDLLPDAIAYAVPQINYGTAVTDDHCLLYGATLLGLLTEEYHERLCSIADVVGATPKFR